MAINQIPTGSGLEEKAVTATRVASKESALWPVLTVVLMVVGYSGYYLCRSNLSVARPLILDEFKDLDKAKIGLIASVATVLYAFGKFFHGSLADRLGGRRLFLYGMVGAVLFTFFFGLSSGLLAFGIFWSANKLVQSAGWVGMVKMTSRWFSHKTYGRAMGVISLSYLFGDFFSRLLLGQLINHGLGWRQIFFVSAAILGAIAIPCWILLRNAPGDRGLPEPEAGDKTLFHRDRPHKMPLGQLLKVLFKSRGFWTVCTLSFGFTFMRETFNEWTPTYLHEVGRLSTGDAAQASSLFPLFGGFSVLAVGYLADRLRNRALLITAGLALGTIGLLLLGLNLVTAPMAIVALTAVIGFVLIGPYSLLGGAISLDFGGKDASATACGWIDGIGYVGGILSGYVIAEVAEQAGWKSAFLILAAVSAPSCIVAAFYRKAETA